MVAFISRIALNQRAVSLSLSKAGCLLKSYRLRQAQPDNF